MRSLSRREFLATASAAAGAAALGVGCSSDDSRSGPPATGSGPLNVIYVTCDDLGTTLGAYGSTQVVSPNIDRFAAQALLFERCYCQIAICSSSRTSILTGVRPETSGLIALDHDWQATLPDARSLPRLFRDAGYQTTSVGKIFDTRGGGPDDCWDDVVAAWDVSDLSLAVDRLEALAASDDPFFLALGSSQPHCPWEPSPASMAEYDVHGIELLGPGRTFSPGMIDCAGASGPVVTDAEAKDITARYFAEITDVDRAFGALMAAVDRLGLLDTTIIIFWSGDHGFHLGQNDRWGKWSCYDAATRVPLVMSVPGVTAPGTRAAGIVECVDMFPTLQELCGLGAAPQVLDGLSFAPVLEEPSRAWKHAAFSVWGIEQVGVRSIKTAQYDYIATEANVLRPANQEVYDLLADPTESDNLFAARPDVSTVLAERLALGPQAALPGAPPIEW